MTACKYHRGCSDYEHERILCCFFSAFCRNYQRHEEDKASDRRFVEKLKEIQLRGRIGDEGRVHELYGRDKSQTKLEGRTNEKI